MAHQEIICVENRFYILTTSARIDDRPRVLKEGDTFAIFNRFGDIEALGSNDYGLFHEGTRFLSRLRLTVAGLAPLLLSSTIREDNIFFNVDLTNPDILCEDRLEIPKGTVHLLRTKFLYQGCCYERLEVENFGLCAVELAISYSFEADYADIFEVRGLKRARRGRFFSPEVTSDEVVFSYQGLDGVRRRTKLRFEPSPDTLTANEALFRLSLRPRESKTIFVSVACLRGEGTVETSYRQAALEARSRLVDFRHQTCEIYTSNEQFNRWLQRSFSDIFIMLTQTPYGLYPYAGIPWFSTIFGRDGIITALECLWINPEIARGVLSCLSATQAREMDPEADAEPGKIVHEIRLNETAATGEIPFAFYYGTVDATPLFVLLAGAYYQRTQDLDFIRQIWPHILLALEWIEKYGDLDDDGLVEYASSGPGLVNKGWKDSHDSVFYEDGRLAEGPIALVEVQGYVYQAWLWGARLASALGEESLAQRLMTQAKLLRRRINKLFWSEELGTYVLALDGQKRPCRVRTSNAGHLLFTEVADETMAHRVAERLFLPDSFSGWGIRTLSTLEVRYNPMSYHNGSIWPHDNALIAYGLKNYGLRGQFLKLFEALFEASNFFELHRMPELFCGFPRRPHEGPTAYPVSCNPQAWSAAVVFFLLQASLGLRFEEGGIRFYHPILPDFLDRIWIKNLWLAGGKVDLLIRKLDGDVVINVFKKRGDFEVVVVK
ncbi:amylo-alpha-1,6-glucosidase [Thermosulfuriphilus ammonigenes]|uniref:Amylo-alpha-1,6-glucosidase n=1 Tax=Thermosulfuriphilus ammonigenes TaxID=1936021 RepID=A0A6G7PWQ3_9BACT|nr:amylo-alpha-1,6-glucosidase [Thermosulfuriphilus ammonigenes]MBA2847672.1 glycogen debranching enzyme [Thermosulfuriphilus ammonigenes]QIJ72119.1 amylo-alpha-1,6-glucosidase [Thermosulfuriphilus ammonigenes]